jgi:hypothetical protein
MLFDLRSRGRRRTVQAVYLGLAVLMGGGLVLFGVGAGNGLGGLLNAFTGKGSSNNQSSVVSQAEKNAIKATQTNPNNPAAWSNLVSVRWSQVTSTGINASTGQVTTAGHKELTALGQDWQRYRRLVKQPDPNVATLAARAYQFLGNYSAAASTWSDVTAVNPAASGFECLAVNAYAANQTRTGDLATAKALSLVPAAQRTLLKSRITQAKTNPSVAQSC